MSDQELSSPQSKIYRKWKWYWMIVKLVQLIGDGICGMSHLVIYSELLDASAWGSSWTLWLIFLPFLRMMSDGFIGLVLIAVDLFPVPSHPAVWMIWQILQAGLTASLIAWATIRASDIRVFWFNFGPLLCPDILSLCLTVYTVYYWHFSKEQKLYKPTILSIQPLNQTLLEDPETSCDGALGRLYLQQTRKDSDLSPESRDSRAFQESEGSQAPLSSRGSASVREFGGPSQQEPSSRLPTARAWAPDDVQQVDETDGLLETDDDPESFEAERSRHARLHPHLFSYGIMPDYLMIWGITSLLFNVIAIVLVTLSIREALKRDMVVYWHFWFALAAPSASLIGLALGTVAIIKRWTALGKLINWGFRILWIAAMLLSFVTLLRQELVDWVIIVQTLTSTIGFVLHFAGLLPSDQPLP